MCFYRGPALLATEILQVFCRWGCSGLITALTKRVERFPSLSSLSSSGGWLNQNIRYSVIPNRPSDCRSPTSSSRFGLDARLSKYRGLFPPSPPACRSWGAEPYPWDWGAAGGDTAGRGTRVSGRRRKAFQQRAAPKQEHHQRDLHQSSLSSFKAQLGFSLRSFL